MLLVEVTPGITVLVSVGVDPDGRVIAVHPATHTVGIGDTRDEAIQQVREVLLDDEAWYCHGRGSTMILSDTQAVRRQAVRSIFGCSVRGKV